MTQVAKLIAKNQINNGGPSESCGSACVAMLSMISLQLFWFKPRMNSVLGRIEVHTCKQSSISIGPMVLIYVR